MVDIQTLESLPNARTGQIISLVETLVILGNTCDKDGIAHGMGISPKSLPNPLRASEVLGFVNIDGNNVELTDVGLEFYDAIEDEKKRLFGDQLKHLEPFATIVRALDKGSLTKEEILNLVKAKMPKARKWKSTSEEAMFRTIRSWCEYGELLKEGEDGRYKVV